MWQLTNYILVNGNAQTAVKFLNKVWIQRNMTEAVLAQDLVDMGIPKEDIVIGLHPSYKRPYTGYGVA